MLPKVGLDGVRVDLLGVSLPDPVLEAIRRVTRLILQGKLALDGIAPRLRVEQLPELGGAVLPLPAELAETVAPPLIEALAHGMIGSIEPARVQDTGWPGGVGGTRAGTSTLSAVDRAHPRKGH